MDAKTSDKPIPSAISVDVGELKDGDYLELIFQGRTIGQWKIKATEETPFTGKLECQPTWFCRDKDKLNNLIEGIKQD